METFAFAVASFLSFFPDSIGYVIRGAFALLALYVAIKLVIAVLDAIPFL